MFVNIIKSCRDVVTICDSNLIGNYFEEDETQLDIKEDFYKGEDVSREKAIEIMKDMSKEDATFNIVGEEAVDAAIEAGIISEEGVMKIEGVPFALILI
ncbi:MAG: DUF424 family protein [Nanoarchaeota archaeon]